MKLILSTSIILLFSFSLQAQYEYSYEETHAIAQDGLLTLDTEDAQVSITGTSRSDAYVKIYKKVTGKQKTNQEFDIEYIEEDGNLTIKEKRRKSSYTTGWNTKTIYEVELGLPAGVSIDIKGEDDNYTITNINGKMKIHSEDGDIEISDCNPIRLDIHLEDGDIQLTNVNTETDIQLEDGNIKADNCAFGNTALNLVDGDIKLNDVSLGTAKIITEDGNVSISVKCDSKTQVKINTEDGDIKLKTSGEGSTIGVSYQDGDVDYNSGDYDLIHKTKRSKELKTKKSGEASFVISVEDGDVRLSNN
ncbi:DUF4097 domain-containing protein [Saprospiraceae bacterium]|nr:DUF4097 domain-containing protein [Saprospiraceae bacterium]